jgi:hypothetical protein
VSLCSAERWKPGCGAPMRSVGLSVRLRSKQRGVADRALQVRQAVQATSSKVRRPDACIASLLQEADRLLVLGVGLRDEALDTESSALP